MSVCRHKLGLNPRHTAIPTLDVIDTDHSKACVSENTPSTEWIWHRHISAAGRQLHRSIVLSTHVAILNLVQTLSLAECLELILCHPIPILLKDPFPRVSEKLSISSKGLSACQVHRIRLELFELSCAQTDGRTYKPTRSQAVARTDDRTACLTADYLVISDCC